MSSGDTRDPDGTPRRALFGPRALDRDITELFGVVKGMICDGVVSDGEAVALAQWLRSHPDVATTFPGNLIATRVQAMFADGILDDDERQDLAQVMRSLCGETADQSGDLDRATRLPINDPLPTVIFDGREFCFTGKFAYGTRARCEAEVHARGGRCASAPTGRTHYVVIGITASPAWIQSAYGTKIRDAVGLRDSGKPIAIIPEEHWVEAIQLDA